MTEKIKKLNSVRLLKAVLHKAAFPPDYIAQCHEELVHRGFPRAFIADLVEATSSEQETPHGAKALSLYKQLLQSQSSHRMGTMCLIALPVGVAALVSTSTIGALFSGLTLGLLTILFKTLARTSFGKTLASISKQYSYD